MVDESRVTALQEVLKEKPDDAFARYALGLEFSSAGDADAALSEFEQLLAAHPDYTNGYFMSAQVLDRAGRDDEARAMLQKGIESARQTNNQHALSEMQAMLEDLQARQWAMAAERARVKICSRPMGL
jgi:tetratricopeptide (TPR) repeat protein